jgi:hypothetical protein
MMCNVRFVPFLSGRLVAFLTPVLTVQQSHNCKQPPVLRRPVDRTPSPAAISGMECVSSDIDTSIGCAPLPTGVIFWSGD